MSDDHRADAVELMEHEHSAIRTLFRNYGDAVARGEAADRRQALAEEICMAMTIHMRLENEMFYPVLRDRHPHDGAPLDDGEAGHGLARELVAQVLRMTPEHPAYDAQVTLLADWALDHMREEGEHLFPAMRLAGINLDLLADRLHERRRELQTVAEALREDALLPAIA